MKRNIQILAFITLMAQVGSVCAELSKADFDSLKAAYDQPNGMVNPIERYSLLQNIQNNASQEQKKAFVGFESAIKDSYNSLSSVNKFVSFVYNNKSRVALFTSAAAVAATYAWTKQYPQGSVADKVNKLGNLTSRSASWFGAGFAALFGAADAAPLNATEKFNADILAQIKTEQELADQAAQIFPEQFQPMELPQAVSALNITGSAEAVPADMASSPAEAGAQVTALIFPKENLLDIAVPAQAMPAAHLILAPSMNASLQSVPTSANSTALVRHDYFKVKVAPKSPVAKVASAILAAPAAAIFSPVMPAASMAYSNSKKLVIGGGAAIATALAAQALNSSNAVSPEVADNAADAELARQAALLNADRQAQAAARAEEVAEQQRIAREAQIEAGRQAALEERLAQAERIRIAEGTGQRLAEKERAERLEREERIAQQAADAKAAREERIAQQAADAQAAVDALRAREAAAEQHRSRRRALGHDEESWNLN